MEIIVLVENAHGEDPRLVGEHGLALLVLAHGRRVLFDTGAGGALLGNADALGLGDALARLDAIVISHGHYDHAGGLAMLLERTRSPTPVHVRPGFFRPRWSTRAGAPRAIGAPHTRAQLESLGARFVEEGAPRRFLPGFWLSGEVPLRAETDAGEPSLLLGPTIDEAVPDPFTDEQALAVESSDGLAVLVGCSHRGLVNAILAAKAAAGDVPAQIVLGGAHLHSASQARIAWTAREARRLVGHVAPGHCTGADAEEGFATEFGPGFHALRIGWRWGEASA
jgi:7,8-dihydropterin-6-yl-methyl-4-(beta-D-ribofuranosyl)aminobenzene 5'-phosphate synthase